jgi:hypothetical protein
MKCVDPSKDHAIGHMAIDMACPTCGVDRDVECTGPIVERGDRCQISTRFHTTRIRFASDTTKKMNAALRAAHGKTS